MQIIDVNQAKLHLPELIEQTMSGDDIVIAQDGEALVKLVALVKPGKKIRQFGGAEGLFIMSDGFDAPIEDFKEYM